MGGRPWTEDEDMIIDNYYPLNGPGYVATFLHGRTKVAVADRALRRGVKYVGPRNGGKTAKVEAYALPAHEYTQPDIEARNWRGVVSRPAEFRALAGVL